jgi:hypothetical protein
MADVPVPLQALEGRIDQTKNFGAGGEPGAAGPQAREQVPAPPIRRRQVIWHRLVAAHPAYIRAEDPKHLRHAGLRGNGREPRLNAPKSRTLGLGAQRL